VNATKKFANRLMVAATIGACGLRDASGLAPGLDPIVAFGEVVERPEQQHGLGAGVGLVEGTASPTAAVSPACVAACATCSGIGRRRAPGIRRPPTVRRRRRWRPDVEHASGRWGQNASQYVPRSQELQPGGTLGESSQLAAAVVVRAMSSSIIE